VGKFVFHGHLTLKLYVKADQKMDQRMIVADLALTRRSACAIDADLIATLGSDAMPYSTVSRDLQAAYCPRSAQGTTSIEVTKTLDDSYEAILSVLDENPFASVRQLLRLTHRPQTIACRRLVHSLGFTARHLRCDPHALSQPQMAERVELSRSLLRTQGIQPALAWHDIVTPDESWFALTT
jgi:hypothetical protein